MDLEALLDPAVQDFIITHEKSDVAALALKKSPDPTWDYPAVLDQIKARQKSLKKLPHFCEYSGIIFPKPDVIEQASSQDCAAYKAGLFQGERFIDLTGGSGADSFALAKNFKSGVIVERDPFTASCIENNAKALGLEHIEVICAAAEEVLADLPNAELIMIDPQRRDDQRTGFYDFESCAPDILSLMPMLQAKAQNVLVKASPMLDIHKAMDQLEHCHAVHIVEMDRECKEGLYHLQFSKRTDLYKITINCISICNKINFNFNFEQEKTVRIDYSRPLKYLYEPMSSILKAGAFQALASQFDLKKLHVSSHLYTSEKPVQNFPGRSFEVIGSCAPNKKALKQILPDSTASITVRNFPKSAPELKRELRLQESDQNTIFATTLADDTKRFILCKTFS